MSTSISIRPATVADADAILPLVIELGYSADGSTLKERLSRIVRQKNDLIVVAQRGDSEICGWLQAHCSEVLESGSRVEIVGMVTAQNARRQGIGRMLVQYAEDWAVRLGVQRMVVRSNAKRIESHHFYPAMGFSIYKVQNVYQKKLRS